MGYSAADIVGKTLYARTQIFGRKLPQDDAPVVWMFEPGQPVGVVHAFLEPKAGRSVLYWMFKDRNGTPYYTAHRENYYNLEQLRAQGVLTIEEKQEAEKPYIEQVGDRLVNGVFLFGGIWAGLQLLKSFRR